MSNVHKNQAKPNILHKICAYPEIISCVLGACGFVAFILYLLTKELHLFALIAGSAMFWVQIVIILVPASLLGFFLGMRIFWPFVRVICSRFNGAPLKIGDRVLILSGKQKGMIDYVHWISTGQGGWDMATLNFDPGHDGQYTDLFEEYSLLKIKSDNPAGAVSK